MHFPQGQSHHFDHQDTGKSLQMVEHLREVVNKKRGYFTVRLTVRVGLLFMIIHELEQILTKKCFFTLCMTLWLCEDEHFK